MNEIRRVESEAEEIARVRAVVERHAMPPFVVGFDVTLGEFEGDPALWVIIKTSGKLPEQIEQRQSRAKALSDLREGIHDDLQNGTIQRYPYFRFMSAELPEPPAE